MRSLLVTLVTVTALLLAAPALGAVRYAEPGGDGPASSCPKSNPCEIADALNDGSVEDGDEVVLLSGTYDLGAEVADVDDDINLHGELGEPRPLITSASADQTLDLFFAQDSHVHDLRFENTGGGVAVNAFGTEAVIERVVAVANPGMACHPPETPGILRDSAFFSFGAGQAGIGADITGNATNNYELRNVTAIAFGAGSEGVRFTTNNLTMTVDARNAIADAFGAGAADVRAEESGTGTVAITLDHSNYNSLATLGDGASVTPTGSGTNQTDAFQLADPENGDFHQLPGSPTIDAGGGPPDVDLLGSLDFERQPRIQGSAPDIGADEFDDELVLKAKARKRQKAKKLKVKVSCPEEECYVTAKGRAKVGGEKFKLKKTKERFLEAGEKKKLKLKAKNAGQLKALLAEGDGKAKIKVSGTDAGGVTAKKKLKVELVG